MIQFFKKTIPAIQFDGSNFDEILEWVGKQSNLRKEMNPFTGKQYLSYHWSEMDGSGTCIAVKKGDYIYKDPTNFKDDICYASKKQFETWFDEV